MFRACVISMLAGLICLSHSVSAFGATNPEKAALITGIHNKPAVAFDIETLFETVCGVGAVSNLITNSTFTRVGQNEWTILIGDDSQLMPSMRWSVPEVYTDNHYLYFASLRIGTGDRLVHLSTDTSPGGEVYEGPDAVSDFDTHFYISDQSELVPPEDRINIRVHENTYAWAASEADDFIIYDFWIVNLNQDAFDSLYVALHADCDVSAAAGGSGRQAFWRDDLVAYYRDDETGEYISYMYDADNPTIPGNDEGGIFDPKESLGFIGSRLLYCPPIVGETTPSVQQGHGWWDWNSDPWNDADWMAYMSDGLWLDSPPSPHDYRFLQKLGPFEIAGQDSIRVVLAFGIGNGLIGMRSNLNNAHLLFENEYVYYDLPPEPPQRFAAQVVGTDIEFSWEPVEQDDLAGYNIYSATDPDGPFQAINAELIDNTYYLYSPPDRGFFYFHATAEDFGGNESWTTDTLIATTLPFPPSDFRAIPGDNLVQLNWSTVEGADAYRIYRANISGGPYFQIAEIAQPGDNYTDNDVTNYQTYFYVATTLEGGYESPYTGEVEVTPNPNMTGRVLLVDDYLETDDGDNPLEYQEKRRFYQRWGVYNFDYDVWVIADQGMPDLSTLQNYQTVLFASDGEDGDMDDTWWYEVGSIGGGVLRDYLQSDGRLLAIGQLILLWAYNSNIPVPGDFEFDWFGIDSVGNENGWTWDYWDDFTWAIGAEPRYPDSMKIDIAKLPDQEDYATTLYSLRPGVDTLFLKGLNVDGSPPNDYLEPVGIVYRPDGVAVTSLINFSLYLMPRQDAHVMMNNILRDEFGCTFYADPAPLPPWHVAVTSIVGEGLYLTWDGIDEEDIIAIRLYRSVDGAPYELLSTLDGDAGEYTDADVSPGITYSYKLTCVDIAGQEGDFSHEVSEIGGRPQAPVGLIAESGDGEVTLRWTSPGDPDIVSFKIYRRMGPFNDFVQIATIPVDDTIYYDTDVINNNFYNYYVTSISEHDVESHPSDAVFGFPHVPGRDGILIINGIDWETYGSQVVNLYQNRSFTGSFPYKFWDLFDTMPIEDFPDPDDILGWGEFPQVFFDAFETIIWAGNNFNGDFEHWENNEDNIIDFLNYGGNLVLPARNGETWFRDELTDYAGVDPGGWARTPTGSWDLVAVADSLTDIHRIASQSFCDWATITGSNTYRLYRPSTEGYEDYAAGFIAEPPGTGKFVFISGRPYRWNNDDLRSNFEIILRYYLGMTQTGIEDHEVILPDEYVLYQNYPNPFNPATTIRFGLPEKSEVRLEIFDILGRQVAIISDEPMDAGYHEIIWDSRNRSGGEVSSGVYFYRLRAGEFDSIKKMLILK